MRFQWSSHVSVSIYNLDINILLWSLVEFSQWLNNQY